VVEEVEELELVVELPVDEEDAGAVPVDLVLVVLPAGLEERTR